MILRMENYKYPSRAEWLEISITFPEIGKFGFQRISEISMLSAREKSIKEVYQLQNLFHWDSYLNRKAWNLRQCYVNTIANYNRGVAIEKDDFSDEVKVINLYQFDFYYETTLYYLIAVRDTILQIVNLAFVEAPWKEHQVTLKVMSKIQDSDLKEIINLAASNLKDVADLRNSMAHKFSKTNSDYRSTVSDDGKIYSSSKRKAMSYEKKVEILMDALDSLHSFHHSIREKLSGKYLLEKD